jgi:hypothetical protein
VKVRSIGLPHPAAIVRGAFGLEPHAKRALRKLARDLVEPGPAPDPTVVEPAPNSLLFPTWQEIDEFLSSPLCAEGLSVDIENPGDQLRIIGFCRLADFHSLVVWFQYRDGRDPWPDHRARMLVHAMVSKVLADPAIPKYMHNGQQHDVKYLEKYGYRVEGYVDDTMLMQRHSMPEQPAGLQWLACNVLGASPWKHWISKRGEEQEDNK